MENFDLDVFPEVDPVDEELKGTPGRFQLLEVAVGGGSHPAAGSVSGRFRRSCRPDLPWRPSDFPPRLKELGNQRLDPLAGDGIGFIGRFQSGGLNNFFQQ